jgi:hypothetical protein
LCTPNEDARAGILLKNHETNSPSIAPLTFMTISVLDGQRLTEYVWTDSVSTEMIRAAITTRAGRQPTRDASQPNGMKNPRFSAMSRGRTD